MLKWHILGWHILLPFTRDCIGLVRLFLNFPLSYLLKLNSEYYLKKHHVSVWKHFGGSLLVGTRSCVVSPELIDKGCGFSLGLCPCQIVSVAFRHEGNTVLGN